MTRAPFQNRRSPGFSVAAIFCTVALIAASIGLGIYGPRMGQRGTRISGEPLSVLRNESVHLYEVACTTPRRDAGEAVAAAEAAISSVFGTAMEVPDLSDQGCRLEGAMELMVAGHRAVWLRYSEERSRFPVMLLLVAEPHDLLHFDVLGRHLPLLPGSRIEEQLVWPDPYPLPTAGMVIRALDGSAIVFIATPPDRATELERAILPEEPEIDDEIEVVAGILELRPNDGPMYRRGSAVVQSTPSRSGPVPG